MIKVIRVCTLEPVKKNEYPIEHLIELKKLSPYLVGRVTIYQNRDVYDSEIDIILMETGKIYKHIGQVFSESSAKDAFDMSYRKLKLSLHKGS